LVFIAVLREGFETVLFIVAKFDQEWLLPGMGAIAGLVVAVILGFLLFKWGIKLNIRLFFQIMGIFLLLIIGGLVIGVLKQFDAAALLISQSSNQNLCLNWGQSCLLGPLVWDWSATLSDQQFPGILLKSLLGYRERLYVVQGIAYLLFMVTIGSIYFRSLTPQVQKSLPSAS
jgi:high-affinity iron transporter